MVPKLFVFSKKILLLHFRRLPCALENVDVSHVITCIKGSVIDYLIANINSLVRINNFIVHDFCPLLSDVHCALSFSINI